MKQRSFIVTVIALLSTAVCFAQNDHPGPDPVLRAATQARNAGRLAEAEKILRDAIHDMEEHDPKSPRLSPYLKQLSNLVARRGDSAEAAALFQQAYELDVSVFGPDDLRTTVDIGNMAWGAHGAGDDQKAEQWFNHVLYIVHSKEANLQTLNDAELAAGLVGSVISYYKIEKRWVEAEVLMPEETKLCNMIPAQIREGYDDCGNLSGVLSEIYRGEGRAVEATQLAPDPVFPADLEALNTTAGKFMDDGLYPSAEDAYNRAIALARKLDTDPQSRFDGSLTMREIDTLGRLYEKEGAKDKAEQAYLTVQAMNEKRAGSEPSQMGFARALNPISLISLYRNEGRFKDAEAVLEHVIELQVKYLGEKHRVVVDSLTTLASVYEQEGQKDPAQYAQARTSYERALSIQESMVGAQHPQLLPLLRQYAQLLSTINDLAKAAEVQKRIDAISAAAPGQP
jgi:tetratricopeptide (TPR) repeat protein